MFIAQSLTMNPLQLLVFFLLLQCACLGGKRQMAVAPSPADALYLVVLGVTQDGGYPHAGCRRDCCQQVYDGKQTSKMPVCLGVVDHRNQKLYILEATPAFAEQWRRLQDVSGFQDKRVPDGIFLTHAHIGHYAGLLQLGREVMGTNNIPVWVMPRMERFLWENGPWRQLIDLQNIGTRPLWADSAVQLTANLRITPFLVPHRDEYSETVGYRIESPRKKVIFIPDIDKWEKWEHNIAEQLRAVDLALLDATFFKEGELQGRAMKEVPHPLVQETMQLFEKQPDSEKAKVTFIHFNHTNPLLWDEKARQEVRGRGFSVAEEGMIIPL